MSNALWERLGAFSGILFVVLLTQAILHALRKGLVTLSAWQMRFE